MPKLTLALRSRDTIAERTMAFHFDKPKGFQFVAGQTMDLTLVDSSNWPTRIPPCISCRR
jgi:hypothetical protein